LKRGIPDRGDVLNLDLDPAKGHEQRGKRPVLVLSVSAFNRFGLILVCPITHSRAQGGGLARGPGFAVPLSAGTRTQGIVLCHQLRTVDYKERGGEFSEALPGDLVEEVLARVRALVD
jgi:mRNA-degrading endonuclease toxin of MazEF toxin-antitoxin module